MYPLSLGGALLLLLAATGLCSAQFYFHQPLSTLQYAAAAAAPSKPQPYPHPYQGQPQYANPSVVANAEREAQLPPELLKSDRFYKNPRIAAALAKESWFTAKEMPVVDREAEKIPRDMVFKIFKNAGWIKRR